MAASLARSTRHRSVLAVPLVAVALLASGCSHGPSAPGGANVGTSTRSGNPTHPAGASTSASAVAYSACVRSHEVPNFPDPGSNGQVPKTDARTLGVSGSQLQAAQHACQRLYPTSSLEQCSETGVCSPADRQELLSRMREFALCMRSHGVPDFPDPTTGPDGDPYFNLLHLQGVDPRSQTFEHKSQECFPTLGGINLHVERP